MDHFITKLNFGLIKGFEESGLRSDREAIYPPSRKAMKDNKSVDRGALSLDLISSEFLVLGQLKSF